MSTINLLSCNCKGLRDEKKRCLLLSKTKTFSIYCLQDTHFTEDIINMARSQWGFECYFSNYNSNLRGVAILLNNKFKFKVIDVERFIWKPFIFKSSSR